MRKQDTVIATYKNGDVKLFNFQVDELDGANKRDRLIDKLRKSDNVLFYELKINTNN